MVTIEKHGILLGPTEREFENNGVFNPGIYQEGNTVHILYRAVQDGNFSTIGYAKTDGPLKIVERHEQPLIVRTLDYEKHGAEDPRIVKIEEKRCSLDELSMRLTEHVWIEHAYVLV